MVRAVPVFGSGSSSGEGGFWCFSTVYQKGAVPVSVPEKQFRRFRFRLRFLEILHERPRAHPIMTHPKAESG